MDSCSFERYPRKTLLRPPRPVLVYCDAAGSGHIAFVLIFGSTRKTGRAHLPEWFCLAGGIYEYELASAIFALHAASLVFPGQPIILCCDNSAAASTIVRGNCESDIGRKLAAVFRAAASAWCTPVWVGEVRSKFNNADPPSRVCPLVETPAVINEPNLGIPELFLHTFRSCEHFCRAQTECVGNNLEFSVPWPCPKGHKAEPQ